MSTLFWTLDTKDLNLHSLFSAKAGMGAIRLGGSADVKLVDGIKSPDYSMYEVDSKIPWPTVVWEVAYSENERKLAYDLGRHIACSVGRVRLAIGVKIELNHAPEGLPQSLKKLTCAFWEADRIERYATLQESGSELNRLTRCDEYGNHDDYVVPPATKFSCAAKFKGQYLKVFVSQHTLYTVSAFYLKYISG